MKTLSFHINQSAYATAIINHLLAEANATNISVSFIPDIASEELIFEYFSYISPFSYHDNQSNWGVCTKRVYLVEDHLTNISKKTFVKISAMKWQ